MILDTPGYKMIAAHYGDARAKRSGVLLIDHINQGLVILDRMGADDAVKEAYAAHPIFQADEDLAQNWELCEQLSPLVTLYVMEYRNCANGFLSYKIEKGPDAWGRETIYPKQPLKLSPMPQVNLMLVGDKVQNRKDFELYHLGKHDRSDELDFYFKLWLKRLGISEERYLELVEGL